MNKIDISHYVSNETGPVFALANLPEEVIAVLFAQYSRSPGDLRTALRKVIAEESAASVAPDDFLDGLDDEPPLLGGFAVVSEKARAFHEKWVVGFGHASVAEHSIIHLGIEGVSILAGKAIEDARLGSFTEKSTRYVPFTRGSYVVPPELEGDSTEAVYRGACEQLFDAYLSLLPLVTEDIAAVAEPGASDNVIRAQALDTLRGLLPASTMTNIGLTANARTMASLISKLGSSSLEELRTVGTLMQKEAQTVAPTMVRHAEPSAFRAELASAVLNALPPRMRHRMNPRPPAARPPEKTMASLRRFDEDALTRIVEALAIGIGVDETGEFSPWEETAGLLTCKGAARLLAEVMSHRGPHDAAPRAFEATSYQIQATLDYGAYRDLQRHRICSPFPGLLAPRLGFVTPPSLRPEHAAVYEAAMRRAGEAWNDIVTGALLGKEKKTMASMYRLAQYVVPLGYQVRVLWNMNLREVFHVIELRSAKQGHASYRRFAQDLYRAVVDVHPWLEGLIRVDLNDYALARAGGVA